MRRNSVLSSKHTEGLRNNSIAKPWAKSLSRNSMARCKAVQRKRVSSREPENEAELVIRDVVGTGLCREA